MRGKPSNKGPSPALYDVDGVMMTIRQAEEVLGVSDSAIRDRIKAGKKLTAKVAVPPKKVKVETIEQKRDRYVDEVVSASLQPGYVPRLAEQIAAAFDYAWNLATAATKGAES